MRLLSSIIVRISLGPLLLVMVSGLSLLLFDMRSETSLRHVIAQHDGSARLKDVIQQAIGDMAAAQQSSSEYLMLSDAGLDAATMGKMTATSAARIKRVREALADLGRTSRREDADKALTTLATYEKAAAQMISMADSDPAMGISLLRTTSRRFG